jgi:hypothetical protein
MAFHASFTDAETLGDFLIGHSAEEAIHHNLGEFGVNLFQLRDAFVDLEDDIGAVGGGNVYQGTPSDLMQVAAMAQTCFLARVVNENMTHGDRRGGEEMVAIAPFAALFGQAQPDFVDEGGGLEGLVFAQAGHLVGGELSEFVVKIGMHDFQGVECREVVGRVVGHAEMDRETTWMRGILMMEVVSDKENGAGGDRRNPPPQTAKCARGWLAVSPRHGGKLPRVPRRLLPRVPRRAGSAAGWVIGQGILAV